MHNPFEVIEARLSNIENLLLDIKHPASQAKGSDNSEDLLTVAQAAVYLDLSKTYVYRLISKNELPHMKRGARVYFLKAELLAYLKQGRNKTNAEIFADAARFFDTKKRSR